MSNCNKGDLISRSELLQEFETENACHNTELWHITGIKAFIESQPTAYDVEKVKAELREAEEDISGLGDFGLETEYALEIVDKGGIEEGYKIIPTNETEIRKKAIEEFTRYISDLISDNEYGFVEKLLDTPYTTMLEVAQDFKNGVDKEDIDLEGKYEYGRE